MKFLKDRPAQSITQILNNAVLAGRLKGGPDKAVMGAAMQGGGLEQAEMNETVNQRRRRSASQAQKNL